MEKLMVMEFLLTLMDPCILDNGKMTNNMEKVLSHGIITKSNLPDSFWRVKKQEKANLNLLADFMKAILLMDNFME
jgi:hypothetical protein